MFICHEIKAEVAKTLALKVESGLIAVESLHHTIKEAVVSLIRSSENTVFNKVKALLEANKTVGAKKLLKAYTINKEDREIAKAIQVEGERISSRALLLARRHGRKARVGHNIVTLKKMCSLGFAFHEQIDKIQEFYGLTKTEQTQRKQFSVSDALGWEQAKALLINEKLEKLSIVEKIVGAMKFVKDNIDEFLLKKQYRESALNTLDKSSSAIVSSTTNNSSSTDEKVAQ